MPKTHSFCFATHKGLIAKAHHDLRLPKGDYVSRHSISKQGMQGSLRSLDLQQIDNMQKFTSSNNTALPAYAVHMGQKSAK